MLRKSDLLNKQSTFRMYNADSCWYDGYFEYKISMENGFFSFLKHDEVDGTTELLCDKIDDIEHLKFLYESFSGGEFELK